MKGVYRSIYFIYFRKIHAIYIILDEINAIYFLSEEICTSLSKIIEQPTNKGNECVFALYITWGLRPLCFCLHRSIIIPVTTPFTEQ